LAFLKFHTKRECVLTGVRLHNDFLKNNLVPLEWRKSVENLSSILDDMTMNITLALSKVLFEAKASVLARKADIPVGFGRHFGMLDFAYYYNTKTVETTPEVGTSVDEVNCVPHYDPGLLSLSFLSNTEGLQLKDPTTDKWVDGPVTTNPGEHDIGVIWLGEAALKVSKNLKAGIHRVVYPKVPAPRLTAWYEMCTIKQATEPEGTYEASTLTVSNLPGSTPIKVKEGTKKIDILRKIERHKGVPMSKVMRLDDSFHSYGDDDND